MPQSPWENEEFARLSLANMDKRFLPGTAQEVDFLTRELQVPAGGRVLDLGCGAGRHAIELTRRGFEVMGIDISEAMLAEARQRAHRAGVHVPFRQVDLNELAETPDLGGPFDAAICLCESGLGVLGGEANDLQFLAAVRQRLKPGGGFALTTLNVIRKYRALGSAFDYVQSIVHWREPASDLQEDQRVYSPAEMRMMLQWSGFREIAVWACSPGGLARRPLQPDDIEMLVVARL